MRSELRGLAKRWFRRDNLIVMVLTGVLLFIIALPAKEDRTERKDLGSSENNLGNGTSARGAEAMEASGGSVESAAGADYASVQEEKLAALLSSIEGVGEVEVMLTFVSTEELVVEKDAPTARSSTVEKDSEGGTRTVTQYEQGDGTVFRSGSGSSEPYVIKTLYPRVEGVLVVAEGAGDGAINRSITAIAQALFGVEAHKVAVMPMEKGQKTQGGDSKTRGN